MPPDQPRAGRAAARQHRTHRRRKIAVAGGVAAIVVMTGIVVALTGGSDAPPKRHAAAPTTTSTTAPKRSAATIATTAVPELAVFAEPSDTAEQITTLPATSAYRAPTALLVDPTRAPAPEGWLAVSVPLHRPNDTPGWVRAGDVTLSQSPYRIVVYLGKHELRLFQDDEMVLRTKVIIGAPGSVTPLGRFYVTDPLNCNKESVPGYPTGRCAGVYGAFAIGTSALSEQLSSFQGTIPQIALHGTDLPATELGKDLSNGCIRMPDEVILQLARITPLVGTPVTITPY